MSNLKREASGTGTMGRERRAEARAWRWWVAAFSWARCVLWAFWNSVGETIFWLGGLMMDTGIYLSGLDKVIDE